MKLRFGKQPEAEPGEQQAHRLSLLFDGPVLAAWYIQYILEREVDRARRYGRPLSVLKAVPELLPGERLSREAYMTAVRAAAETARTTDLVGRTDEGYLLMIMPETEPTDARTAASRWRDNMWISSRGVGGTKWRIEALHEIESIEKINVLQYVPKPQPQEDDGAWKVA